MGVGLRFVESPGGSVERRSNGDVPDDGHPHVRVGLETEGHDRHDDEEHRDDPDHLKAKSPALKFMPWERRCTVVRFYFLSKNISFCFKSGKLQCMLK